MWMKNIFAHDYLMVMLYYYTFKTSVHDWNTVLIVNIDSTFPYFKFYAGMIM